MMLQEFAKHLCSLLGKEASFNVPNPYEASGVKRTDQCIAGAG